MGQEEGGLAQPKAPPGACPVQVRTGAIPLGAFLKLARAAATGGQAKQLIQQGRVFVNGVRELRRHRKLVGGDVVAIEGIGVYWVKAGQGDGTAR